MDKAPTLEEATVLQIILDDDVGDGIKDELDVVCVCGAGEVGVDFLSFFTFVQVLELHLDICGCFLVRIGP